MQKFAGKLLICAAGFLVLAHSALAQESTDNTEQGTPSSVFDVFSSDSNAGSGIVVEDGTSGHTTETQSAAETASNDGDNGASTDNSATSEPVVSQGTDVTQAEATLENSQGNADNSSQSAVSADDSSSSPGLANDSSALGGSESVLDNLQTKIDNLANGQNTEKTSSTPATEQVAADNAAADSQAVDNNELAGNSEAAGNNEPAVNYAADNNAAAVNYAADTNTSSSGETTDSSLASVSSQAAITEQAQLPEEPTLMTDALLDKQLREVSTSVDTLKEDTFTTKSRLLLLREEVLQRSVGGARLQLRHKYDMGGQYELVQVFYAIDQEPVFSKQDPSGKLSELDGEIVFDRMVAPGPHQLSVLYVYKGRPWGVFRYMKGYTFRVESGYDFNVEEGKAAELIVTAAEEGNFFTAYEKRPGIKYDYQQYELTPQANQMKEALTDNTKSSNE